MAENATNKMETPKPDCRNISKSDTKEAKFPIEIAGEYRVFIEESAYAKMKAHTDTTNEVELCGVLVGDVCRDSNGPFLKVVAVIEGKNANNYGAQVTFTHQTWEHINPIKDRDYPNQKIVGWYHTHPGFGVFLSGMDMFIQENYFNHPYQVAIVVETKKKVEGCFAWVDGKSVPLTRYWAGKNEIKLALGPVDEFDVKEMHSNESIALKNAENIPERTAYAQQDSGSMANSYWVLIMMMLMAACGYMFGKLQVEENIKTTNMAAFESEVYSLLEFAALNTGAAADFADVDTKLSAISKKVAEGDKAGADAAMTDLSKHLKEMEATYGKRRSNFESDMAKLMMGKQHMSERVVTLQRTQEQLTMNVAGFYLVRLQDLVTKDGQILEPTKLTPLELAHVKDLIERTVKLVPEMKANIKAAFPKYVELFYGAQ